MEKHYFVLEDADFAEAAGKLGDQNPQAESLQHRLLRTVKWSKTGGTTGETSGLTPCFQACNGVLDVKRHAMEYDVSPPRMIGPSRPKNCSCPYLQKSLKYTPPDSEAMDRCPKTTKECVCQG